MRQQPLTNPFWGLALAVLKHYDSALANARRTTCVQREYSYVLMKVLASINRTQRVTYGHNKVILGITFQLYTSYDFVLTFRELDHFNEIYSI